MVAAHREVLRRFLLRPAAPTDGGGRTARFRSVTAESLSGSLHNQVLCRRAARRNLAVHPFESTEPSACPGDRTRREQRVNQRAPKLGDKEETYDQRLLRD